MYPLAICNIIIGLIIILTHIFKTFEYVTHSTENIIIVMIGCIFLCTGFILLGIAGIIDKLTLKKESTVKKQELQNNKLLTKDSQNLSSLSTLSQDQINVISNYIDEILYCKGKDEAIKTEKDWFNDILTKWISEYIKTVESFSDYYTYIIYIKNVKNCLDNE